LHQFNTHFLYENGIRHFRVGILKFWWFLWDFYENVFGIFIVHASAIAGSCTVGTTITSVHFVCGQGITRCHSCF